MLKWPKFRGLPIRSGLGYSPAKSRNDHGFDMFYTYVLSSLKTDMFYVGSTEDIEKRLIRHNKDRSKFTKGKGPWKVVYFEQFEIRAVAIKREFEIKSWKSRKAIESLISRGPVV